MNMQQYFLGPALVDCYHSFLTLGPEEERIVQVEVTLPVETQERQLLSL